MRTITFLAIAGLAVALPACHKTASTTADQNAAAANNLVAPPADIETLPPDESAGSANQVDNNATYDDVGGNEENDVD